MFKNISHIIESAQQNLMRPTNPSSLGLFRILFGLIMLRQVFYHFNATIIDRYFIQPSFHFSYSLFDFLHLHPWPDEFMFVHFLVMGMAALAITLGLFYRLACIVFFCTFSYVFLLEKTLFNNHYYLIALISFLLIFMDAHHWLSFDRLIFRKKVNLSIPFWQIYILRMQIVIVYFYGAVAKLNYDWLIRAEPMREFLKDSNLASFSHVPWLPFIFSWGGFGFDLLIAILLFRGRYRILSFLCVLFFNLMNHLIFHDIIGVFPFLMLAVLTLFLDEDKPQKIMNVLHNKFHLAHGEIFLKQKRSLSSQRVIFGCLILYLSIQVLVPLRHWLIPGKVGWTDEGSRFAWRMKLDLKNVEMAIIVEDPETGKMFEVDPSVHLASKQFNVMGMIPDMLLQYVHFLREEFKKKGMRDPVIRVYSRVSLNGRPYQPFIDSRVNLANVEYPLFSHASWILPFHEK